jgi:hypothetical protein
VNEKNFENDSAECNVCGSPKFMDCHPNCPNKEIRDEAPDFFAFLNNVIMQAADEFFVRENKEVHKKLLTERMIQFQEDWKEMVEFTEACWGIGYFRKVDDIIHFLRRPDLYSPIYLLWLELEKPTERTKDKAMYSLFKTEALNRRK